MKNAALTCLVALIPIGVLCAGIAFGDMAISVTISGPIEEIVPLLQHLKELGVGTASSGVEGPAKVQITSVATVSTETPPPAEPAPPEPPAPSPPPPPPKPPLALLNLKAEPGTIKPGGNLLLAVQVSDPDHVVDTVAATIEGMPGSAELYDNATHGDATAGDGLWSAAVTLPPDLAPGEHAVGAKAFNANGIPVTAKAENQPEAPLFAQTKVTVQP
jgi:hypothetical protein